MNRTWLWTSVLLSERPTDCVSGLWVGRDSTRKQKNIQARKILENAAESHKSAARFVGQPAYQNDDRKKTPPPTRQDFTRNFDFYQNQKLWLTKRLLKKDFAKQTRMIILENLILPKIDKANEANKILQTQLTRTFAEKRQADFENLQNQPQTKPKPRNKTNQNQSWPKRKLKTLKPILATR